MSWIDKLKEKWGLKSMLQVIIVLIVFSCTGFTVLLIREPVIDFFTDDGQKSGMFGFFYYLLILPIYNVILLIYGFLFGQFEFFWNYEKRMINRFRRKKPTEAAPKTGSDS